MVVLKEVDNMFWALFLEAGKRYSQKVENSFHISMAALEIPTDHDQLKAKHNSVVAVMVGLDKGEFLLSSLNYKSHYQQPLDLNFNAGDEVTFFLNGDGNVHLTGYLIEEEPELDSSMFEDADIGDSDDDDEEDSDYVPELVPAKGAKRKKELAVKPSKKLKWISNEAEEADSDEDSDEDEEMDSDEMDDDMLEFEDFEDEEEDEDEEEEESEEEEVKPKKGKQTPKAEKTPKQDKQQKQEKQKSGKKENKTAEHVKSAPQTPANNTGPEGDASESKKKKKKKKKKKNQASEAESTPQQQQKSEHKSQTPGKTPKKQVLAGGTVMEELRPGTGTEAKSGKMVHVYYVGKLQKDGRQFDSCTSGKPFRFRLGSQEVIKGWDTGLAGMKVGGKRKLVIPPQQGYGNQKMGGIPPNSTLVFEVELKNVS